MDPLEATFKDVELGHDNPALDLTSEEVHTPNGIENINVKKDEVSSVESDETDSYVNPWTRTSCLTTCPRRSPT